RGDQIETLRAARALEEVAERAIEGVDREAHRLGLVEHAVLRIDARRQRMRAQDARAEAVDRRDPRALGLPRALALAELHETAADPRLHLRRRLLREGDGEDAVDRHAVVADGAHEALHEHARLSAAGARLEEERAVATVDR